MPRRRFLDDLATAASLYQPPSLTSRLGPCSYHSSRSLLLMKQYRIGRVQEPWTNLEPPIRSPDFYENLAADKATKAEAKASRRSKSVDISSVRGVRPYLR